MSYADGGYLSGWNDIAYFKPEDGEKVLIAWSGGIDLAYFKAIGNYFELCDDCYRVEGKRVNYWMRIPPVPQE